VRLRATTSASRLGPVARPRGISRAEPRAQAAETVWRFSPAVRFAARPQRASWRTCDLQSTPAGTSVVPSLAECSRRSARHAAVRSPLLRRGEGALQREHVSPSPERRRPVPPDQPRRVDRGRTSRAVPRGVCLRAALLTGESEDLPRAVCSGVDPVGPQRASATFSSEELPANRGFSRSPRARRRRRCRSLAPKGSRASRRQARSPSCDHLARELDRHPEGRRELSSS